MKCKIEINLDSDAFQDEWRGKELFQVLCALARQVKDGCQPGLVLPALDYNGNDIGQLTIEE